MLNLREYQPQAKMLADYLPWGFLVAPGIILNKDGSFLRLAHYRGPDLESATQAELVGVMARINNVLKRFGSGWALFFEARRKPSTDYPQSDFPDPVSLLVDEERRKAFEAETTHFETDYVLSFCWLPPAEVQSRAGSYLIERSDVSRSYDETRGRDWLQNFQTETERAVALLGSILPEIFFLDDMETLTHLHARISPKDHPVRVPNVPAYLDALLSDTPLTGGLVPKLGNEASRSETGEPTSSHIDHLGHATCHNAGSA